MCGEQIAKADISEEVLMTDISKALNLLARFTVTHQTHLLCPIEM